MEFSTSCRELVLNAIRNAILPPVLAISTKPTTKSAAVAHTERFAYYLSLNGNRSNYGLQPPIGQVVHDAENGFGGFGSLIYNLDSQNQFRVVGSLRQDYYQIPIDPDPNSIGNQSYPSYELQ